MAGARRFYCENCGGEVAERDDVCPHCAAFFVALQCPQCGFQGKEHRFTRGCPRCGFLGDAAPHSERLTTRSDGTEVGRVASRSVARPHGTTQTQESVTPRRGAPGWVPWVFLAVLVSAFIVLARLYVVSESW